MANSNSQTSSAAPSSGPAMLDAQVGKLYAELPAVSPSPEMDQQILRQARQTVTDTAGSGRWIWPVSLAASLVICSVLVTQMARVVNPSPVAPSPLAQTADPARNPSQSFADNTPNRTAADPTPPPAIGSVVSSTQPTTMSIEHSSAPQSAEFWWDQLRHHAHNADRDGFLATWEVYQNHRDNTPLPDDLQRWMADNRVPLNPPAGG